MKELEEIKTACKNAIGIPYAEIEGSSRQKDIVLARQLFFYYATKMTKMTCAKIGENVKRDHATVLHGVNKIKGFIKVSDKEVMNAIRILNTSLKNF
jgi:chromosomal replication initiation ATPase DnaA